VLAADRESQERFSGHGSALAQAYNHLILPLANSRDKRTQIEWGRRDFMHRFGRLPEAMWLPETAVDLETLELMAERGMKFAILDQRQAHRVRRLDGKEPTRAHEAWLDVSGVQIDPTLPYKLNLPSGRAIALFFYDGAISQAVAFGGLLDSGENLADRLVSAFHDERDGPQLAHIATDGETYGHHRPYGDMALAYALHRLESSGSAQVTNYGEFLEKFPPRHEVQIYENTSWSCIHGVERWRSDCGCRSGNYPHWNQGWRGPLREALDWLRDAIAPRWEEAAGDLLADPWQARDDYIDIILDLDRSPESRERFFAQHAARGLGEAEKVRVLKLLELQRHAMLMYTSCGWFFDDISGLEAVQVIQYAGRALQLAADSIGDDLERPFLERLERSHSNIPEHANGRRIYEKWVKPSLADLAQVAAHYAISSLFEDYGTQTNIYCYDVEREDHCLLSAGQIRLALGRATVTSRVTGESRRFTFGVLHLGDHNVSGGVCEYSSSEEYEALVGSVSEAIEHADLPQAIRAIDDRFGSSSYSLRHLFRDEQRKILSSVLNSSLEEAESLYRQVYEQQMPTMRLLAEVGVSPPRSWHAAAEMVVNARLRRALGAEEVDPAEVAALVDESRRWNVALDQAGLAYALERNLERLFDGIQADPADCERRRQLSQALEAAHRLPFPVSLWKVQNDYYELWRQGPSARREWAARSADGPHAWLRSFATLGEMLGFQMTEMGDSRIEKALEVFAYGEGAVTHRRVPRATYRLQLNRAFTLADARNIVPYLRDLGISDLYASPLLRAGADSDHGYDVTDHSQINPALGGQEAFDTLAAELAALDMGLILDVVPNHMGIGDSSNYWWQDVLENGPSSAYSSYFDIEWYPVKPELQNRVLLPILGEQYGKALESGRFRLQYEEGAFFVSYGATRLPLAPETYGAILGHQLESLKGVMGEEHEHVLELESILTALSYLPGQTDLEPERVEERRREKEVIKRRIDSLYRNSPYIRAAIETTIVSFNGRVGEPRSFDRLDDLLRAQAFRPAFWRVAAEEINYRRFFDVNELAAIRVEIPAVFQATHDLVLRLLAERKATGLRIDHPDGLWNPRRYFRHLQESYLCYHIRHTLGEEIDTDELSQAATAWLESRLEKSGSQHIPWPLYVVAEKILSRNESLPADWAVDGTTGYDFLAAVNGLFVDPAHRDDLDRCYRRFIGKETAFASLAAYGKRTIMLASLASEVDALAHRLERITSRNRLYRDFTLNGLALAIREVIAALPVYRTYIDQEEPASPHGQEYVEAAVAEVRRHGRPAAPAILDFLRDTLLLRNLDDFPLEERSGLIDWVMRFQQVTGPVMAKGVEDTAFYRYNRLVSLNEVGCHPDHFGLSVAEFHRQNQERLRQWPHSLLATSTHDTKRSEDVRARISVLSELPEEWEAAVTNWSQLNSAHKAEVDGSPAPERNDEYLLYQTLIGAWPEEDLTPESLASFRTRIAAYMNKATKEAKARTSWINANEQYDAAVQSFVQRLLAEGDNPFLEAFRPLQRRVAFFGRLNSLSQTLLKLASPGVPDFYQGTELWDFSLVDPDNRRPVDYQLRQTLLADMKKRATAKAAGLSALASELLASSADGRIKLYLTSRVLAFRRENGQLFAEGTYEPIEVQGEKADHVVAFARRLGDEGVLVIAPRLVAGLTKGEERFPLGFELWGNTTLALPTGWGGHRFRNLLTGQVVPAGQKSQGEKSSGATLAVAEVLSSFPVALLVLESSDHQRSP